MGPFRMTRAQRIVLIAYCLLAAYCCLWVPWQNPALHLSEGVIRPASYAGYAWVWAPRTNIVPDVLRIALRLFAATALSAALFVLAGFWKSATRS
jgi:hypothetical protein